MAERTPQQKNDVIVHWLPFFNECMKEYIVWKKKQVCDRITAAQVHNDVTHVAKGIVKELDDAMQMHLIFNQVFNPLKDKL